MKSMSPERRLYLRVDTRLYRAKSGMILVVTERQRGIIYHTVKRHDYKGERRDHDEGCGRLKVYVPTGRHTKGDFPGKEGSMPVKHMLTCC